MKKIILLSSVLLLLTGCQTANLITPEYKIIKAPDNLYNCPTVTKFPKPETLTDEEVGKLILKLQRNNIACKNASDAVRKFYIDAEKTINEKK